MAFQDNQAINDPIHGMMAMGIINNSWLKPFIDSFSMQRLRHIKQLGFGELVFPGATHTRFNHSLGASFMADRMMARLTPQLQALGIKEKTTTRYRQLVVLAVLLHDIGHGPFSHSFEGALQYQDNGVATTIKHEQWTPLFLEQFKKEKFLAFYNRINPDYELNEDDIDTIAALISGEKIAGLPNFLPQVVSSQLDADRLDYLLRDSHFCGVAYGHYNPEWLISCLNLAAEDNNAYTATLAIEQKGIGVIEHYLMARRLMTHNVYLHPKNCVAEFLLQQFIQALTTNQQQLCDLSLESLPLVQFVQAFTLLQHGEYDLKQFLLASFANYRQLCDFDVLHLARLIAQTTSAPEDIRTLAYNLYFRRLPDVHRLPAEKVRNAQDQVETIRQQQQIPAWQISVYTPDFTAYIPTNKPILVLQADGSASELAQNSLVIGSLAAKTEQVSYLFVARELRRNPQIQQLVQSVV